MRAILYATALRFHRQRVWAAALLAPALVVAWAFAGGGEGAAERASRALLGCLVHLLPVLLALFVLAPAGDERLDLLLVRPVGWPRLLAARWLAGVALFGGCHLVLALGLAAVLAADGSGREALTFQAPRARLFAERPFFAERDGGPLLRPWPAGPPEAEWIEALGRGGSWRFRFEGLAWGGETSPRVRLWPYIGRIVTDFSGERPRRELARGDVAHVEVAFLRDGAAAAVEHVELRDEGPADLTLPRSVVGPGGPLELVVTAAGDEESRLGSLAWGPPFLWFHPAGGADPRQVRDVRVIEGTISLARNTLRACLWAAGKLLLVGGLAVAAGSLFSTGIAWTLTLGVYAAGSALPFFREVLSVLSHESVVELLEDAWSQHGAAAAPGLPERALEAFLQAWVAVLPDLSRFDAGRYLAEGEAAPLNMVLWQGAAGAVYALACLGAAALLLRRREVRR